MEESILDAEDNHMDNAISLHNNKEAEVIVDMTEQGNANYKIVKEERKSGWEKLAKVLIRSHCFPISFDAHGVPRFRMCSCRTFIYIIIYLSTFGLLFCVQSIFPSVNDLTEKSFEMLESPIDRFAIGTSFICLFLRLVPNFILVAKAIPDLWELVEYDHKQNKNSGALIVSSIKRKMLVVYAMDCLVLSFYIVFITSSIVSAIEESPTAIGVYLSIEVIGYISIVTSMFLIELLITTCLENFIQFTQSSIMDSSVRLQDRSKKCLHLYETCKNSLEWYLVWNVTMLQILVIMYSFVSLTFLFNRKRDITVGIWFYICACFTAFISNLAKIFFIAIVSSNCHKALKKFIKLHRNEQMETIADPGHFFQLENIVKDIETIGPFIGCGFFKVEKRQSPQL